MEEITGGNYNKFISPVALGQGLGPNYGTLNRAGSKNIEKIKIICENSKSQIKKDHGMFSVDFGLMANIAFNCRAEEPDPNIDFVDSCVEWGKGWKDYRLRWDFMEAGFVTEISMDPLLIWTPPIEIVNLDEWRNYAKKTDFSCIVNHLGEVKQAYKIRAVTSCEMSSKYYPFDVQICSVDLATPSQTQDRLVLDIRDWKSKNGLSFNQSYTLPFSIGYKETDLDLIKNAFHDENTEFELIDYRIDAYSLPRNQYENYTSVKVTLAFARKTSYYEITLFLPIVVINLLVSISFFEPLCAVSSGESISFQVTMLLTSVVYLDILSNTIPVFEDVGNAPRLLFLFLLTGLGSAIAHIVITVSLWCQTKTEDRIFELSKRQAKFALLCARFYEKFMSGKYRIPSVISQKCGEISSDNDTNNEKEDFDRYHQAWLFYAKMLSHFWALILTVTIMLVTFAIYIDLFVQSCIFLLYQRNYAQLADDTDWEQRIFDMIQVNGKYNKYLSPLNPRFGILSKNGSKDEEKIRRVCERMKTVIRDYDGLISVDLGLMANIGFYCRAKNAKLDFVDACVEWTNAVWFQDWFNTI
ncbi:Oidioi.mRNA.OKI2018_I69.PAR.g8897.t1.cds [Oikopleura dioica]|uniref:Oidioi.mRNA.OKI2018_I69.PAR.g8897.t1.cds n=1 Tax=Oikopleura dioica TaxID=34765 RepID=A0ABN7RJ76_OIKDI|nr:Oidioi.mRNA.OKI2018_I69.PAR.g8897.t1.cds [Oikopleura dioica]